MMDVLAKIRSEYDGLSKANKRVADYLLFHSDQAIGQTSQEIGLGAEVSAATVIRFVKQMGFSGLEDLKVQLAADFGANGGTMKVDPIISKEDSIEVLCQKVKSLIDETSNDVVLDLDMAELSKAIKLIQNAKMVYLLGIGASALPAYDLFHKFTRAHRPSFFSFDAHITLEAISFASPQDVVVIFTYSGHTKEMILAMEYADKMNIPLVIITRNTSTKIRALATAWLRVPGNEHLLRVGAISSLYSSMMVATILYLGVIQRDIEDRIESRMIATKNLINPLKDNSL